MFTTHLVMFAAKRLFASSRRCFSSSAHTLVVADHDNAKLLEPTLASVSAATKIGGKVTVLVAGTGCDAVAKQVCVCGKQIDCWIGLKYTLDLRA